MIFAQGPVTLAPGHGVVNAPERAISRAPTPRRARRAVALRSTLPRHPPWVDHVHNPHFVGSGTAVDVHASVLPRERVDVLDRTGLGDLSRSPLPTASARIAVRTVAPQLKTDSLTVRGKSATLRLESRLAELRKPRLPPAANSPSQRSMIGGGLSRIERASLSQGPEASARPTPAPESSGSGAPRRSVSPDWERPIYGRLTSHSTTISRRPQSLGSALRIGQRTGAPCRFAPDPRQARAPAPVDHGAASPCLAVCHGRPFGRTRHTLRHWRPEIPWSSSHACGGTPAAWIPVHHASDRNRAGDRGVRGALAAGALL